MDGEVFTRGKRTASNAFWMLVAYP